MTVKKSRAKMRTHTTISARAVHRVPVDTRKLARALIELAAAQAEADAQADQNQQRIGVERRSA